MSIIALAIFLFTVGVGGLILYNIYLAVQKANVRNRIAEIKLVDEQYQEVVQTKEEFKDVDKKQNEINKFTKENK
jgi:Tfp pilus assembly protein PilN